jgi:hypothetical protein
VRALAIAIALAPSLAAADVSVPSPGAKSKHAAKSGAEWQGKCAVRLEQARREAARREPIFAKAKVEEVPADDELMAGGKPQHLEGVELRIDEGLLSYPSGTQAPPQPEYFAATVVRRAKQWQDLSEVQARWAGQAPQGGNLSQYRQTHELEGTITAYHFRVGGLPLYRVVEGVIKPAVDECMKMSLE